MKSGFRLALLCSVLTCVVCITTGAGKHDVVRQTAADHRDAPTVIIDPAADINDVYAFVNPNTQNVVLAMTVNPFQAPGNPQYFSPEVLYQFKIDNDGDFKEDLVIQATFDNATADQKFTIVGPAKPKKQGTINELIKVKSGATDVVTGSANATIVTGSNMKVFAGLIDDPFFFDLVYVERLVGILPGGPVTRAPGIDYFAGFNVSVIAIEIPASMLKGAKGNSIHVWGTTSRSSATKRSEKSADKDAPSFVQIERMGLPAINTVLIRSGDTPTAKGALKDSFNRGEPSTDVKDFKAEVTKQALLLNNDAAYTDTIVGVLLPDVLTLDVTNTGGFLNGRRPQDDVIDAELNVLTHGAVTSDGVNANDKPFLTDFPFFATPHTASETVPVRE
jgi:hypothetical protein